MCIQKVNYLLHVKVGNMVEIQDNTKHRVTETECSNIIRYRAPWILTLRT